MRTSASACVVAMGLLFVLCLAATAFGYATATSFQFPLSDWNVGCNDFWSDCNIPTAYHLGEDVGVSAGTPVYAIANGLVKEARLSVDQQGVGYGGLVIIEHFTGTENVVSVTGHMNAGTLAVSAGQEVSKGQLIGYVGNYSQNGHWGEHVHLGIHKGAYQSTTSCDGGRWVYAGYDYSGCTENDWYVPTDFINSHQGFTYSCTFAGQTAKVDGYYNLHPGDTMTVWVDYTNSSSQGSPAWTNNGGDANNYVELKSCEQDGDIPNNGWLHYSVAPKNWINSSRVTSMNQSSVAVGNTARFEFVIKVPDDAAVGIHDDNYFRINHATGGLISDWAGVNFPVNVIPSGLYGDDFIAFVGYFNGDNKADIGLWDTVNGDWYFAYRDPNSNTFVPVSDPLLVDWAAGGGYKLLVADFSADGYDDLCVYHYATGKWFVAYNWGDHFAPAIGSNSYWIDNWATGSSTAYIPLAGKYNNDGLFDIAVFHPATGRWFVAYNSGSKSFASQGLWLDDWGDGSYGTYWPFTGKLNTDAYYDVGCYHPGTGRWFGAYRSGSSFSPSGGIWLDNWASGSSNTWKNFFGKSSSDSYDDVIVYKPSVGKWCVAYNWNGYFEQAYGADYQNSWLYGWAVEDGTLNWQTFAKDVSGDGYVDLIAYTPKYGRWFVAYNWAGPPPYFDPALGPSIQHSWLEGWGIETGGSAKVAEGASETVVPSTFFLSQNYPNPFNPVTIISYSLPAATDVTLDVFNILGQKVTTLVNQKQEAGEHTTTWDASTVASGVYFYRVQTAEAVETKKMVLLK